MHELSIACSIVEAVEENLPPSARAGRIFLEIGSFAGVVRDALEFSFEIAAEGTRCAGARLAIEDVPLTVYCRACACETELAVPPVFRCGKCGAATGEILRGKELNIVSVEIEDGKAAHS